MKSHIKEKDNEISKLFYELNKKDEENKKEIEKIENQQKKAKEILDNILNENKQIVKDYEERTKLLNEKYINNIKKFEDYLKVLEKRISYVNNEITIIYKINKNEKFVKIFDKDFVEAKKKFCKILYNGKEYDLQENFNVENINKYSETLEIKLKVVHKIISFYSMFYNCTSLLYLPDISKFDTSNITNMIDMFAGCSSLLFLPDILLVST